MEDKDLIDKILDDVVFEKEFYEYIAETDEYDVISFNANSRSAISNKDDFQRKALEAQCERSGLKVLYHISYGTYGVVFCKDEGDRVGIIPEEHPDGWPC